MIRPTVPMVAMLLYSQSLQRSPTAPPSGKILGPEYYGSGYTDQWQTDDDIFDVPGHRKYLARQKQDHTMMTKTGNKVEIRDAIPKPLYMKKWDKAPNVPKGLSTLVSVTSNSLYPWRNTLSWSSSGKQGRKLNAIKKRIGWKGYRYCRRSCGCVRLQ